MHNGMKAMVGIWHREWLKKMILKNSVSKWYRTDKQCSSKWHQFLWGLHYIGTGKPEKAIVTREEKVDRLDPIWIWGEKRHRSKIVYSKNYRHQLKATLSNTGRGWNLEKGKTVSLFFSTSDTSSYIKNIFW